MAKPSLILTVLIGIAVTGCGGGPTLDSSSTAVGVMSTLPPADTTITATDFSNYRIGPLDVLAVEVFGAPELNREGEVDSAGNLSLPLVGTILAGGRTPRELGEAITERLRGRYLKNPQVTVNVRKARSQTVTIDGAVRQPGVYPIIGKMTLQQAIATARGADEMANLNNVVIFRTVRDQKLAALFNLKDIRAGRYGDPQVYGNDIIVVGENATRRFFKDLTSSFPTLGTFVPIL